MKVSKITLVLSLITLVLSLMLKASVNRYYYEKREKERLYSAFIENQQALKYIKTLDDKIAAQSNMIELRTNELKELYPSLAKEIANLKVKLNRVSNVSQTAFSSEKQITTLIKDSIILDTIKVKVFNYQDEFYTVKGLAIADTQRVDIHMRDTLIQVVYKGKRKHPCLWIFSKRQLEQRIALKNPNAKIEYSKVIEVKK